MDFKDFPYQIKMLNQNIILTERSKCTEIRDISLTFWKKLKTVQQIPNSVPIFLRVV